MKRKWLSMLLALCLVVGMIPVAASAADDNVAQVGNNTYATVAEAVQAVIDSDTQTGTVTLLQSTSGGGIGLFNSKGAEGVDLTIDLGGFTYTCTDPAVGSIGTESQGFHFEKGNTVTLKNGTINVSSDSKKTQMLIQNYCDLTLEDLTLNGSAVTQYIISSNYGDMKMRNVNIAGTHSNLVGIDLMHWLGTGYADQPPTITIENTSDNVIDGSIDVYCYGTGSDTCESKPTLSISGGAFSADVSKYTAEGYTVVEDGEGHYVVQTLDATNAVAQVGESYYKTLAEAVNTANDGETVTLLKTTTGNGQILISDGRKLTLNMNGFDIGFAKNGHINIKHGALDIIGSGKLYEEQPYFAPIMLYGSETDQADYTTVTVGKDVTLQGWSGLFIDYNNAKKAYGVKATVYGTLNSVKDIEGAGGHALYLQGMITDTTGNVPEIVLDGATLNTEDGNGMYLAGYAKTTITDSTIISNSEGSTGIEIRAGELEITNSTIIGGSGAYTGAPNGNGSTSFNVALAVAQHTTKLPIKVTVHSGTFSANAAFIQANPEKNEQDAIDKVSVNIEEGNFNGLVYSENKTGFITSGYFTSDPSEYLAGNKIAVESDKAEYNYMVSEITETPAEVVNAAPEANVSETITSDADKTAAQEIQSALTAEMVTGDGLTAAANSIANENTVTADEEVLKNLNGAIGDGAGDEASADNTKIVIQPYMDIAIEKVDTVAKTVTLDITPMYRTVATTANLEENGQIVLVKDGDSENVNAVQIGQSKPLTITKPVDITLTLPSGFTTEGSTVYIQHKGYEYTATVNSSSEITFTNPHGFSEFTFSTQSQAVAKINGTSYTTLQAAVDAVKNGETITLLKNDLSATVSKAVTFKVASEGGEYTATFTAGNGYVLTDDGNGNYVVTYAGGGGSATEEPTFPFEDVSENAWYYDAVKYVYENSIMAGTGDVTFDPEVKLTRAMAVQILYNLEGKPEVTTTSTFTDLDAGAWYIDAVNWASANGVVAGMGDNTFAPDINVSREQFAQMMYNYATYKKYDVSKSGDLTQFPDNGSVSSWATTAMSWANGNGLINGTELSNGSVVLDPQGTAIRAQAASILMNFDKNLVK